MLTAIAIVVGVLILLVLMFIGLPLVALVCGVLPTILTVVGVCFLIGALLRRPVTLENFLPAAAALGAAFLLNLM